MEPEEREVIMEPEEREMNNDSSQKEGSSTYTNKLALSASSLSALYILPLTAQAGIVHQTTPVSHSVGGNPTSGTTVVDWDVDGNASIDFNITAIAALNYSGGSSYGGTYGGGTYGNSRPSGRLEFNSAAGGQGMVQQQGDGAAGFRNLPLNFQVGPALSSPYQWGPSGVQNRNIGTTSDYTVFSNVPFSGGGDEYFGFRFEDSNGQTLYGWAEVNFDFNGLVGMTIEQWAYDDSGAGIQVGQVSAVPAPPALYSMLSGLALGAGGLLRGRRQRKAAVALEQAGV